MQNFVYELLAKENKAVKVEGIIESKDLFGEINKIIPGFDYKLISKNYPEEKEIIEYEIEIFGEKAQISRKNTSKYLLCV
jgi:hypothetical protein